MTTPVPADLSGAMLLKIEVVIVPGTPAVRRMFDITGLTHLLPFASEG
jgi:hypothetical protein